MIVLAENKNIAGSIDPSIGLLTNVPQILINKIFQKLMINKNEDEKIEITILYRYSAENIKKRVEELGGDFYDLQFNFALINIPIAKIWDIAAEDQIQYMELPKSLYESQLDIKNESCGLKQLIYDYNLTGRNVIAGFIDSGIDYTHPAFNDLNGNTRILYIYDLDKNRVYSRNDIDKALKSPVPYDIIPENDLTGHGTHVAGEVSAGGRIPSVYKGIAEDSDIIMVKGGRGNWVLSSNIMKGLKFLLDKSKELNMPLVVNISLSTNNGSHDGSSLLEQYISAIADLERVTIVVAAGNEGDTGHHTSGEIWDTSGRTFNVASDESILVINLYKTILPDISIIIISPNGQKSSDINLNEGYYSGNIGSNRYDIYVSGAKPFDLASEVQIILSPLRSDYLTEGTWKIEIKSEDENKGEFYMWMPISESLNPKTRFLNPVQTNTLGIPATVENIISVGSYNPVTNTLSSFSGRGRADSYKNLIKPDVVAPGEDIIGPLRGGGYDKKTGTSMAAPHVAGICILFTEWGIVNGNDPYLYGQRLKYYLIKGADRSRTNITYPNEAWGYGAVCVSKSFSILQEDASQRQRYQNRLENDDMNYVDFYKIKNRDCFIEKNIGGLFIRIPKL